MPTCSQLTILDGLWCRQSHPDFWPRKHTGKYKQTPSKSEHTGHPDASQLPPILVKPQEVVDADCLTPGDPVVRITHFHEVRLTALMRPTSPVLLAHRMNISEVIATIVESISERFELPAVMKSPLHPQPGYARVGGVGFDHTRVISS